MRSLILTLIALMAGPIFAWNGLGGITQGMSSKGWPTVPGSVRSFKVMESRGRYGSTSYQPVIRYSFKVDGKTYQGKEISSGQSNSSSIEKVYRIAKRYPKGKEVTVHYNPDEPEVAVLEVGIKGSNWMALLFGLVLTGGGVVGAFLAWKRLNDDNYDHS